MPMMRPTLVPDELSPSAAVLADDPDDVCDDASAVGVGVGVGVGVAVSTSPDELSEPDAELLLLPLPLLLSLSLSLSLAEEADDDRENESESLADESLAEPEVDAPDAELEPLSDPRCFLEPEADLLPESDSDSDSEADSDADADALSLLAARRKTLVSPAGEPQTRPAARTAAVVGVRGALAIVIVGVAGVLGGREDGGNGPPERVVLHLGNARVALLLATVARLGRGAPHVALVGLAHVRARRPRHAYR